ncbi:MULTISPECIES: hypothetical protein [Photorhabdus]|uniref:Uncharacterized protein n=2 Tax=Photorhabdus asymbiotica TaxID=291112 RepID=C7BK31_PHOAA|nr:hypothetical protein [Photorhabdus asymbiotica]RKS65845.1 hypothetical protein BDD30_0114 [Photorhabdus asymbiotica]CAQ84271.1 conserved hypothetical protein [Photorhabdus asymbiotica]
MSTEKNGSLRDYSKAQLAEELKPYYDEISQELTETQKKKINFDTFLDDAYNQLQASKTSALPFADETFEQKFESINLAGVSECVVATGVVILDVFGIIGSLVGIRTEIVRSATRSILRELGQSTLHGLQATIRNISKAPNDIEKAREIWALFSQLYNAIGKGTIFKAFKDAMPWYEWLKAGVLMVAQITAWFASGGLAFVATVALMTVSIVQLVQDCLKAIDTCKDITLA